MKLNKYLAFLFPLLLLSCSKEFGDYFTQAEDVTVGFLAGGVQSRTSINDDGISTSWENGDEVALWAIASDGSVKIDHQTPFQLYFRDVPSKQAMFTRTITGGMAEGTYNYYAAYPVPNAVSGTNATFTLPAAQNGLMSNGAAIMIATPTSGSQLGMVTDANEIDDNHLSLTMNHATHGLRFYVPSNKWDFPEDDKIVRIVFTIPQNIAGDMTLDYTNPSAAASVANGVKTIDLNLAKPIGPSASGAEIDAAYATIIPTSDFADSDQMEVKIYSQTQIAVCNIPLKNPTTNQVHEAMAAGTITSVGLDCSEDNILSRYTMTFYVDTNNLGENPNSITLTLDSSLKWGANETNVLTIDAKNTIYKEGSYTLEFDSFDDASIAAYKALANQSVTITFDSDNAITSQILTLPDTTADTTAEVYFDIPYLFAENFESASTSFNINGGLSATNRSTDTIEGTSYGLPGWTGSQVAVISTNNGKVMAIRHQNECSRMFQGTYRGRVDSAPITTIKSGKYPKIQVQFVYTGQSNRSDSTPQMSHGYTATTGKIAGYYLSGSIGGYGVNGGTKIDNLVEELMSIPSSNSNNLNQTYTYTTTAITNGHRLSWDCYGTQYQGGALSATKSQQWLFIDNIKVQIVK